MGSPFKLSNLECFESIFVRSVRIIRFVMKRGFQLNAAKEVFNVLLIWKFVGFLDMWTKFKPLLRTDFSESKSSKFYGMVTTVLRFSGDESLVIWGPISWSSFWALIWCKFLKSLELASWILARMDSTKTAGQINRYSMFGKRNKSDLKTLCVFH